MNRTAISVVLTAAAPRSEKPERIDKFIEKTDNWIRWAQNHFRTAPATCQVVKYVVAIATAPNQAVQAYLNGLAERWGPDVLWDSMKPDLVGPGHFFGFAVECGLRWAEFVVHLPADVDYGNPHSDDDVQNQIRRLLDPISDALPGERVEYIPGNYSPRVWDEASKSSIDNRVKVQIEEVVVQQIQHYFPDEAVELFDKMGITRPRSEFFAISEKLYSSIKGASLWSPFDPGPEVLIYAIRARYRVERVDLGLFYEQPRSGAEQSRSIRSQIWRTAAQIGGDWLKLQEISTPPSEKVTEWRSRVLGGMTRAFDDLESVL